MPFIILEDQHGSKNLFYREFGVGVPLLFLHGGWGYGMYPFDAQIEAFKSRFRILIPDRTGYGQSPRRESFPRGFHEIAAAEMRQFLSALGIDKCVLWGHSDGAVTAGRMALTEPDRFPAVILEAIHHDRCKPRSRGFFETAATNPRKFGMAVATAMAKEHGDDYWEYLMRVHGQAWLDILDTCEDPARDLYSGRIGQLRTPALLIHGSEDPRTEPNELAELKAAAPTLQVHLINGATHSPHSEPDHADNVTRAAAAFFDHASRWLS
jgi:pimeloyl-ACP methyl ester carboxylesterase